MGIIPNGNSLVVFLIGFLTTWTPGVLADSSSGVYSENNVVNNQTAGSLTSFQVPPAGFIYLKAQGTCYKITNPNNQSKAVWVPDGAASSNQVDSDFSSMIKAVTNGDTSVGVTPVQGNYCTSGCDSSPTGVNGKTVSSTLTSSSSGLCISPQASVVGFNLDKSSQTYTWSCQDATGSFGGCYAYSNATGKCPATPVAPSSTLPAGVCDIGTPSVVSYNASTNSWNWTCSTAASGGTAPPVCSADVIASCGAASGLTPVAAAPVANLCSYGVASSAPMINANGTTFSWTCAGTQSGNPQESSGLCTVPAANGNCADPGCSNLGISLGTTAPTYCSVGSASNMSSFIYEPSVFATDPMVSAACTAQNGCYFDASATGPYTLSKWNCGVSACSKKCDLSIGGGINNTNFGGM
jgi:hypothetical protein